MGTLTHDVRRAVRNLRNNPGSTAVIILALGLGIAVNAAVFSLVDAVLFKPLPGDNPQRLIQLLTLERKGSSPSSGVAHPIYKQYRDEMKGFADLAAYHNIPVYFSTGDSEARQVIGAVVTGNFFRVLGVNAQRGRLLSAQDDGARGSNPVVILSDQLWRRLGTQNVIGSSVRINGHPYTVIGVAPPDLKDFDRTPEFWIPMSMATQALPMFETQIDRETNPMLFVLGRLADHVSLPKAQSKLDAVDSALGSGQTIHLFEGMEDEKTAASPPPSSSNESGDYIEWQRPWGTLKPAEKNLDRNEPPQSWLLLGAASLVLLIACVDVAGLLVARSARRQKETAIRLALGAPRLQLFHQRFIEGMALAIAGAVVGMLLAFWTSRLLLASAPSTVVMASGGHNPVYNLRVFGFVSAISLLVGVGLSLLTTWRETGTALLDSLKSERGMARANLTRAIPAQAALVAFQIAVSFVLLSSAGLLLRTLQNAARLNLGFAKDHVLSAWLDLSRLGYDKSQGAAMLGPMLDGISHVPGVQSAALTKGSLLSRHAYDGGSANSGAADCSNLNILLVSPGYFRTLQIPLLQGRDFSPVDGKNAPGVAIVNQAAATLCWPGKNPLQQYLSGIKTLKRPFEIIGLASNVKYAADNEPTEPLLYVSMAQFYEAFPWQWTPGIVVRTSGEPHAMIPAIMSALHRLDANLVLNNIETPDETVAAEFGEQHFISRLLLIFGGLALVLAAAGLYGLLSYLSARRTREFGIRLALGARRSEVLSLVLLQGGRLIVGSIVVGVFAAAVSGRVIRNFLFGVSGTDPLTYAAMAAFILLAGLVACSLPAWRATRVDPMVALREE